MGKRFVVNALITSCVLLNAQATNLVETGQLNSVELTETTSNVSFEDSHMSIYSPVDFQTDAMPEIIIADNELEFVPEIDDILLDTRGSDVLVSNDPPYPPHRHSCLAKDGSNNVYCTCEGTYDGDPCIVVYDSHDNGRNWNLFCAFSYGSPWEECYPSIAVTQDYIVLSFDLRYNGEWRYVQCARAPKQGASFSFFTIDNPNRGLSDLVWMGGNTVGCVYNFIDEFGNRDVEFRRSTNGGETWSGRVPIYGSSGSGDYFRPKIYYASGLLHVAFFEYVKKLLHYSKSSDLGNSWSTVGFYSFFLTYPDICSYSTDDVLIPCRQLSSDYLYYIYTTNGGSSWNWAADNIEIQCPECIEQDGNWCVAYAWSGSVHYATSSVNDRPFNFVQVDDVGVIVVDSVVGICRDSDNQAHVSWTDTRDGQKIWGEMPASVDEYIEVTAPNGGESWIVNNTYDITWTSTGISGYVRIEAHKGTIVYDTIVDNTLDDGIHHWTIPSDYGSHDNFRIKIISINNPAIHDSSDDYFEIVREFRNISFADREWTVRDWYGNPGSNFWCNGNENVWVDGNGWLHLKITHVYNTWYCSEITTEMTTNEYTRYGMHRFYIIGRLDSLDKNVVFSPYIYRDNVTEVDIEFAKWGWDNPYDSWYVVQPGVPGNKDSFAIELTETYSTHYFDWQEDSIRFKSIHGHYTEPPNPGFLIHEWVYTGGDIPSEEEHLYILINLYLNNGNPPSDTQEVEMIVKDADLPSVGPGINDDESRSSILPTASYLKVFHNSPNPSGKVTTIQYSLPFDTNVRLNIYDSYGRLIKTLVDEFQMAGFYNVDWNLRFSTNDPVPSGVYFYQLEINDHTETKKMIICR